MMFDQMFWYKRVYWSDDWNLSDARDGHTYGAGQVMGRIKVTEGTSHEVEDTTLRSKVFPDADQPRAPDGLCHKPHHALE
jgi:hypothetical protein